MKFADFICPEAIRADLAAVDKEGAIREIVKALQDAGKIDPGETESIVKAILKREELGSTGIGRGVAVPHTKHPSVDRLLGTVAVSRQGILLQVGIYLSHTGKPGGVQRQHRLQAA